MTRLTINREISTWLLLCMIVILASILRFYDLGRESYWWDEFVTVRVAQENLLTILQGGRPPLYIILAHFWIKLFGTTEMATRSLSAIAGVAAIPVLYVVGRNLFDKKVGLISAFLMAIPLFQIYYSQEFRYYSVYVLITLISFYFFIAFLKEGRLSYLILYTLSIILLFLLRSHHESFFL